VIEHAGGKPKTTISMHLVRQKEEKGGSAMKYLLLIYQDEGAGPDCPRPSRGSCSRST
jgi:hypothetical protein